MSSFRTRLTRAALAGAGLAAVGSLALAGTASATVSPTQVGTGDGTAGYIETQLGHNYTEIEGTFTLNADARSLGVTTSLANPDGAEGFGLCNNGNGDASEEGVVENANHTFNMVYAEGNVTSKGGADRCVNNGILTNGASVHPLLNNLTVGDSVTVLVKEYRNGVGFYATDNSTGQSFSNYKAFRACVHHEGHWAGRWHHRHWVKGYNTCTGSYQHYNEALVGVMQSLTNLGGSASNDLVDFNGAEANYAPFGVGGTAEAVNSSGDGVSPWLVGPANSTTAGPNGEGCTNLNGALTTVNDGSFSVCAATGTGA